MARVTDPTTDTDESLMLRYAAGNLQAFNLLYERHEMGVWRYVFRSVRVQAVADDLLQDVWFALARQAPHYQPTAKFKTWLFTLAHNRLVDYFRTAKQHVSLDGDDETEHDSVALVQTLAANSGFGPLRRLESKEQAKALLDAIEELPFAQREAFMLQAEAGMDVQEIAKTTGVSFETAKSRLRYARSRLKELLQEYA
ncbi:sigma-70 family RNA polymerase sigma factor [Rhodoferax sp. AJA081-3]|uniref:sigma-70 family RNA polymerase sigma factor n=1 Tax=Rhodoferax sp. AJA081-3 TaxID=2752316 RepID=UPI001FD83C49|nr:sigma-70 family RNA polymerase sigma factor [Rhodoferax sp. AJA081-3]